MIIEYDSEDAKGNLAHGSYEKEGYNDITVGCSDTIDMNGKIKDGATVKLKVFVKWGYDNAATQSHTFRANSTQTASYTITGTTRNNKMGEIGIG